jgi:hypothetical protein
MLCTLYGLWLALARLVILNEAEPSEGSRSGTGGENLCLWGPERFFSVLDNAQYTYSLLGRTQKTRVYVTTPSGLIPFPKGGFHRVL